MGIHADDQVCATNRDAVRDRLKQGWRWLFDLFLPPRCAACRVRLNEQGFLCPTCFRDVPLITEPWCVRCGLPFDYAEAQEGDLCAECLVAPMDLEVTRSASHYAGQIRRLILRLKHGGGTDAALPLARFMMPGLVSILNDAQFSQPGSLIWLVPVPLHRWRLWKRRYNQSQILAEALTGLVQQAGFEATMRADLLKRVRATPTQKGRSRTGRATNVQGAFQLNATRATAIEDAHVILVDDVLTTGATLSACARAILKARPPMFPP